MDHWYDDMRSSSIVFDSRETAYGVLDRMDELLERYGRVSAADLFEIAGLSCQYMDNEYGWTDLNSAYVEIFPHGYVIQLPRAIYFHEDWPYEDEA